MSCARLKSAAWSARSRKPGLGLGLVVFELEGVMLRLGVLEGVADFEGVVVAVGDGLGLIVAVGLGLGAN